MRYVITIVGTALVFALLPVSSHATAVNLIWTATTGSGTTGGSDITAGPGDTLTLVINVVPDASGVGVISISLSFDSNVLSLISAVEVGSPVMPGPVSFGLTTSTAAPLSGDCGGDGAVGVPDLAQFLATLALPVPPGTGCDFSGDGIISLLFDFPPIANNYQLGSPTAPAANLALGFEELADSSTPIPQPPFTLGVATFQVLSSNGTSVDLFFNPKIDGVADGSAVIVADSGNPTGVTLNDATVNGGPPSPVPLLSPLGAVVMAMVLAAFGTLLARSTARGRAS